MVDVVYVTDVLYGINVVKVIDVVDVVGLVGWDGGAYECL